MEYRDLVVMFDELSSELSDTMREVVRQLSNLSTPYQSLSDYIDEFAKMLEDFPLITLPKKKIKFKQPIHRLNYIQPKIRLPKYLPYQRRVY